MLREVSNVFSSGGGRVMSEEMGLPFLGAVPVDVKFGEIVEGKIPQDLRDDSDEEDSEKPTAEQQNGAVEEDHRPLVEKYKDCWSLSIFEGFAKTLIGKIEGTETTS
jgi:hypothetical protein